MSEKENTALIQRLYQAFGTGDLPTILDNLTDDVDWHYLGPEENPIGGKRRGRDQVKQFFETMMQSLDVESFAPEEFIAQNDTVVVVGSQRMKVKRTAKGYEVAWVHVFNVSGGKVFRFREFSDTAAVMAAHSPGAGAK